MEVIKNNNDRAEVQDVACYASNKNITDELSKEQLKELDEAISEADSNDTIDWNDFKKEINEWKKDRCIQVI